MMGTELGRRLSAKEPRCVGELLLFANEGSGGCSTTQTCCCPPLGGEEYIYTQSPARQFKEDSFAVCQLLYLN